jgi:hypothetical protein
VQIPQPPDDRPKSIPFYLQLHKLQQNIFKKNFKPQLYTLFQLITHHVAKISIDKILPFASQEQSLLKLNNSDSILIASQASITFQKTLASIQIQRAYRKHLADKKARETPYESYLSYVQPSDPQFLYFAYMYGQRVAALSPGQKGYINNPFLFGTKMYRRTDISKHDFKDDPYLFDIVFTLCQVKLSEAEKQLYYFVPIFMLETISASEAIERLNARYYQAQPTIKLFTNQEQAIGLIAIPIYKADLPVYANLNKQGEGLIALITAEISALGLVASHWKLASLLTMSPHIKHILDPLISNLTIAKIDYAKIYETFNKGPGTVIDFFNSSTYKKLETIAYNKTYPTFRLALICLKLFQKLTFLNLSPEALKRITWILSITLNFHAKDYPHFANTVYSIIHEISLALLNKPPQNLLCYYDDFERVTKTMFSNDFNLGFEELKALHFIAIPTGSGSQARITGLQIAAGMYFYSSFGRRTKKLSIYILRPNYYEFSLKQYKHLFNEVQDPNVADIIALSTGPIVEGKQLIQGIDINLLLKMRMKSSKPVTLLIDTTTTLHRNLRLDDEVKEWILTGNVSCILYASAKFSLVHSDEAQAGYVVAFLAKKYFKQSFLQNIRQQSQQDYINHPDFRIGAYIISQCGTLLEEIKQQHFENGALLRDILSKELNQLPSTLCHPPLALKKQEYYFLNFPHLQPNEKTATPLYHIVNNQNKSRDSIGHFNSTIISFWESSSSNPTTCRLSAGASDTIDMLIEAAFLYLSVSIVEVKRELELKKIPMPQILAYSLAPFLFLQSTSLNKPLSLAAQILCVAIGYCAVKLPDITILDRNSILQKKEFKALLLRCQALTGREAYCEVYKAISKR